MLFSPFLLIAERIWRRGNGDGVARPASLACAAMGIPPFHRSAQELAFELSRARRYRRPLAAVVLSLERDLFAEPGSRSVQEGGDGAAELRLLTRTVQLVSLVLGSILRDALREGDIVSYDAAEDRYVIFLTESNKPQARQAVERLDALFYRRTLAHFRAGIAEFPTDGLTLGDLVSSAEREWRQDSGYGLPLRSPVEKTT